MTAVEEEMLEQGAFSALLEIAEQKGLRECKMRVAGIMFDIEARIEALIENLNSNA